ncbi:alpha/beta fold hydrolase [Streptomyces lutosisoli]|uniref:Alpha/beta fold hydrolase n=1 Tax=Streptomyces lutosisoli TaxID=2665721 RepID=A0ABW2W1X2_9ACTN
MAPAVRVAASAGGALRCPTGRSSADAADSGCRGTQRRPAHASPRPRPSGDASASPPRRKSMMNSPISRRAVTASLLASAAVPATPVQEQDTAAAWKKIPSWYLVAAEDRNIPPAAEKWMAERAGARTITVRAPHAVAVRDPGPVTDPILSAAC